MAQIVSCQPLSLEASVQVGFLVENVTLGQVFLWVLWLFPVTINSPMLHIQSSIT